MDQLENTKEKSLRKANFPIFILSKITT